MLNTETILAALPENMQNRKIIVLNETDSTNNLAKKLAADGAEHGTAVIADTQSSGRGRLGRSFVSPPGCGLYMSVIIRPDFGISCAPLITPCAACAAADAVEKLCGQAVGIKWVNDLYMNGRKICGILTESAVSADLGSLEYAVIGIGINVRSVRGIFDSTLARTATSVEDETGVQIDRSRLCAEILSSLENCITELPNRGFLDAYRRREILTGHEISANTGSENITGTAVGIDDNANLAVRLADGRELTLVSGEANLCRMI